jgi:hypothetical protein
MHVSAAQYRRIMEFQQKLDRKGRKEHRGNNLWCFLFANFAFFVVNSSLAPACRTAAFEHFGGKSIQVPVHE